MNGTRRQSISGRIVRHILEKLAGSPSWSFRVENASLLDGRKGTWFVGVQRAGSRHIAVQERVTVEGEPGESGRYWIFSRNPDGLWLLESAERDHAAVDEAWINDELEELFGRLHDPGSEAGPLEVPVDRRGGYGVAYPSGRWRERILRQFAMVALFGCVVFILFGINAIQYHRVARIVSNLDDTIVSSSRRQSEAVVSLTHRLEGLDNELVVLKEEVAREREAFEFSRKNTAMSIRQMADELPRSQLPRRNTFNYLADRIEAALSYGEIIYQLTRLPEDNAQAETIMAVDRANVVPLSRYESTIPGLVYPVRLDGEANDGKDFMISGGFGEMRPSDLGVGGWKPHLAVDIINVRNILTVTAENDIIRFPGESGSVVSVGPGTVIGVGRDQVYGWHVEIEHPLTGELARRFPGARKVTSFYAHMIGKGAWKPGDSIEANEKIGDIGETGRSTGPHLHFEIRIYRREGEFAGRFGMFDRLNPYILRPESSSP